MILDLNILTALVRIAWAGHMSSESLDAVVNLGHGLPADDDLRWALSQAHANAEQALRVALRGLDLAPDTVVCERDPQFPTVAATAARVWGPDLIGRKRR